MNYFSARHAKTGKFLRNKAGDLVVHPCMAAVMIDVAERYGLSDDWLIWRFGPDDEPATPPDTSKGIEVNGRAFKSRDYFSTKPTVVGREAVHALAELGSVAAKQAIEHWRSGRMSFEQAACALALQLTLEKDGTANAPRAVV